MQPGMMDRLVTLQTRTLSAADAYGEKVPTWSTLATVWASRRDITGREFFAASQDHAESMTRYVIRHRTDVTVIHRLVDSGVTYDIVHIAEIGRGDGLELLCRVVS